MNQVHLFHEPSPNCFASLFVAIRNHLEVRVARSVTSNGGVHD